MPGWWSRCLLLFLSDDYWFRAFSRTCVLLCARLHCMGIVMYQHEHAMMDCATHGGAGMEVCGQDRHLQVRGFIFRKPNRL